MLSSSFDDQTNFYLNLILILDSLVGCCGGALAVVIGRAAPFRVEVNAQSSFGFHRKPSSCARGTTASGDVTCMLHAPCFVLHARILVSRL